VRSVLTCPGLSSQKEKDKRDKEKMKERNRAPVIKGSLAERLRQAKRVHFALPASFHRCYAGSAVLDTASSGSPMLMNQALLSLKSHDKPERAKVNALCCCLRSF
jgi:hypothetical protein